MRDTSTQTKNIYEDKNRWKKSFSSYVRRVCVCVYWSDSNANKSSGLVCDPEYYCSATPVGRKNIHLLDSHNTLQLR